MRRFSDRIPHILLAVYVLLFIWGAIGPYDRAVWWAENIPIVLVVLTLVALYLRGVRLSPLAYILMAILPYVHTIGGHYTFERVPFDWFNRAFGFERNMYDRIGHFSVGFYAFGIAEYLLVRKRLSVALACLFAIFAISFVAMSYELIEWVYAAYGGNAEAGADFLGSQGDIWDAQKDMLMDTLGAVVSIALYLVLRARPDRELGSRGGSVDHSAAQHRSAHALMLIAAALFASGCVLSVSPVVGESDATFDPGLLGTWEEVAGSDRAVVSRGSGNTYRIEYTTDGKATKLEGRLGRLGGRLILDVWPAAPDSSARDLYSGFTIPGHALVALDVASNEVRSSLLEPDSLLARLQSGDVQLEHARMEDRPILQGTTERLRAVLAPYLSRPGSLSEPAAWRRVGSPDAKPAPSRVDVPCFEASAWRAADKLFRVDPHWVGADVASTVDLGGGRILWLFGDSWIDPSGTGKRRDARMVSNSVAIQTGTDPSTAAIKFYWGRASDGKPAPLFPDSGGESLWFGNGIRVRERLVLFFARTLRGVTQAAGGLGFEHIGWTAVMVENPDDEPSAWRVRSLETPANPLGVLLGFADVIQLGEHVYALGSQNPVKSHPIYAARWRADEIRLGNLVNPEWWAGERVGWAPDSSRVQRYPIFENGRSELSVHLDPATQRFIGVQSHTFGPSDVMLRAAPALTGPWTTPRMVYRPPEYYRPNVAIYAGKGHPELTGADLVLTYVNSSFYFPDLFSDSSTYYPRFVRLMRCE